MLRYLLALVLLLTPGGCLILMTYGLIRTHRLRRIERESGSEQSADISGE